VPQPGSDGEGDGSSKGTPIKDFHTSKRDFVTHRHRPRKRIRFGNVAFGVGGAPTLPIAPSESDGPLSIEYASGPSTIE